MIHSAGPCIVGLSAIPYSEVVINTMLELYAEPSTGLYMVNISAADPTRKAGDAAYTQPLVIQK
ncbi:MAG: hypothetical protein IPI81_16045 [Flavobacteriales bacterium]|nr:hypothetical protein [Flavobacteriales bacterium]MCC6938369.1 hypothetical protein [Flavobacteriales bacterium]